MDDRGKTKLDACQFLKYAMSVTESKQNADGIWFYNFSEKHYDLLEHNQIRKIFYYIFAQADESLWRSSMQVQYMEQYLNKVPYFMTSGYDAGVLQFDNCILDISDGNKNISAPTPDHFCQFRLLYCYDENADCPQFLTFLYDIFEGDEERVKVIQEVMGACLYYGKCIQNLIVFLGNGSNGKSVLAATIRHMLGDRNVSAIALDRLSGEKFSRQNLDGKLLNISSETKGDKVYSTADFKALTGGDSVEVEKKFQDAYTTEIYSKYIVLANEMIQTDDNSDGFYRRLLIVPFNQKYEKKGVILDSSKKYQDAFLEQKLKKELSGIFNFALEGFFRLYRNGLEFSYSVVCDDALRKFRNDHNVVLGFLYDCMDFSDKVVVKADELFPAFENYCRENHYIRQNNKTTKKKFFQIMEQAFSDEQLNVAPVHDADGDCFYLGMKFKR